MSTRSFERSSVTSRFPKYSDFLAGNSAGGYESIATASGGGVTNVSFTNIPQTYHSLQIRAIVKDASTSTSDQGFAIRINGNTQTSYSYHYIQGDGAAVTASNTGTNNFIVANKGGSSSFSSYANMFGVAIIDIDNYANSSNNKTLRLIAGTDTNTTTGCGLVLETGVHRVAAAVTSIQIIASTSWVTGTSFALYGIKGV